MDFQIRLRPFRSEDAIFINKLRQLDAMEEMIGGNKRSVSLERDQKWVQDIMMGDSQYVIYYAITKAGSEEIIGYNSIGDIDYRNGTCSFSGIKIDPASNGKGYGTQVVLRSIKYVFEEMRMERCFALVLEENAASVRMFEKAGFAKEGLMRCSVYKNNRYNNQWLMSIVKADYAAIKNRYDL